MRLTQEMKDLVQEQRLGFVATVCPDGSPNLSPKGTTAVWDDEHLVFLHIASPSTIANLTTNPITEINVVDPIRRLGYRFKGEARIVSAPQSLEPILDYYRRTRGEVAGVQAAVLVRIDTAAALVSPVYATGASVETVARRWFQHHAQLVRRLLPNV